MPPIDDDRRDDDDRPRRRRSRDDDNVDDGFDDGPRRRRPKKSNSTTIIIIVVVGLVVCTPCGIGLLLPAVQKVREAASRSTSQGKLTVLGLAQHNHQDAMGNLAGPVASGGGIGPNEKLSFRVDLLPYIEQASVYAALDRTQAWDSPRNQPHTSQRIPTFAAPDDATPNSADTPYRAFVGGGAIFNDVKPTKISDITDGTSNTILMVQAADSVPWAKPQELKYGANLPLPALGKQDGFLALMADGSVKFIRKSTPEATIRALITKAGGETVPNDF